MFIGFEFASYTYTEEEAIISDPFFPGQQLQVIYLIKSTESEQTFNIIVRATPGGGDRDATLGYDYNIGGNIGVQLLEFNLYQERLLVGIYLSQDDTPEPTETFKLISLQLVQGAPFNPSINATCTVFIVDDNDCKCH